MKVAVIGSRGLEVDALEQYLPSGVSELISGGAKGIDACARRYAEEKGIPLTEILPQYGRYGRGAPHRRNAEIVARAETVVAFWDGCSRGTESVIALCRKTGKAVLVFLANGDGTFSRRDAAGTE